MNLDAFGSYSPAIALGKPPPGDHVVHNLTILVNRSGVFQRVLSLFLWRYSWNLSREHLRYRRRPVPLGGRHLSPASCITVFCTEWAGATPRPLRLARHVVGEALVLPERTAIFPCLPRVFLGLVARVLCLEQRRARPVASYRSARYYQLGRVGPSTCGTAPARPRASSFWVYSDVHY